MAKAAGNSYPLIYIYRASPRPYQAYRCPRRPNTKTSKFARWCRKFPSGVASFRVSRGEYAANLLIIKRLGLSYLLLM